MTLFDLHCDTVYELAERQICFDNSELCVNSLECAAFERYTQIFALWSDYRLSEDGCWQNFWRMLPHYNALCAPNLMKYLAVEGGRLLGDDLSRLSLLRAAGVKYLTLVWRGEERIGTSHDVGESDANYGLTDFGRQVVRECFRLGIIPDVSHGSARLIDDTLLLADECGRPVIATHSNAYAVHAHSRNLSDAHFRVVVSSGGIVGVCMAANHVGGERGSQTVDAPSVLRHIEHYLSLGENAKNALCLGCDFDGAECYPKGIEKPSGLYNLAELMAKSGYQNELIENIFWKNAERFFQNDM